VYVPTSDPRKLLLSIPPVAIWYVPVNWKVRMSALLGTSVKVPRSMNKEQSRRVGIVPASVQGPRAGFNRYFLLLAAQAALSGWRLGSKGEVEA
jgi:hypothetical protein